MNRMLYGIAVLAVCGSFLHCATKKQAVTEPPAAVTTEPVNPYPVKTILSGVVKNEQGDALGNAAIKLSNGQVANTDASGNFSIETEMASPGATVHLYVQHNGMVPVVRSYHAAMQQAFYDIVMKPPYECSIKPVCFELPYNSMAYDSMNTSLNETQVSILSPLADSLKAYPNCLLRVVAYGKGNKPGSRAEERLRQIQLFFTEKGITENRIVPIRIEGKTSDLIELSVIKN